MRQSSGGFRAGLRRFLYAQVPLRIPHLGKVFACLSILGIAALAYVLGAAVMFFQLPSYDFLHHAFTGGRAWEERGQPALNPFHFPEPEGGEGVTVDKPGQTCDGFTLVTTTRGARATLLDMRGKPVHQWEMPFSRAWPRPPHVRDPLGDDKVHWFRCHLFPNGDLLAVYQAENDTPCGYGLIKLDKDSKLLWKYEDRVHHDLDVDESGTIYTLTHALKDKAPPGLEYLPTPYIADSVLVLSANGQRIASLSIDETLRDSAYALLLSTGITEQAIHKDPNKLASSFEALLQPAKGDVFHANSVKVLSSAQADKFPLFRPGQVLVSLRSLHCLAVADIGQRAIVWATSGPWRIQHEAQFLGNGHLLLFDNHGWDKGCRVIEYDPVTQALPWVYSAADAEPIHAGFRGMCQALPNGNVLIVDPDSRRLVEVSRSKELAWEYFCPAPSAPESGEVLAITGARRYREEELPFLKGVARARP